MKLGDPTQRMDGFGGAPAARCGVVRGAVVVVDGVELTGVVVDEVDTGGGGGGGVVGAVVVVVVLVDVGLEVESVALPTGGMTNT